MTTLPSHDFEPQITAFCCRHCAYAAADMAGGMRLTYPAAVKILELPCTGKVDILHILRAFEDGCDGVLVAGCLEGDCHYLEGNLKARRRVAYARQLLAEIGLESRRIKMINLSAAMGSQFAQAATDMTAEITDIGPNPLREPTEGVRQR